MGWRCCITNRLPENVFLGKIRANGLMPTHQSCLPFFIDGKGLTMVSRVNGNGEVKKENKGCENCRLTMEGLLSICADKDFLKRIITHLLNQLEYANKTFDIERSKGNGGQV